jgi:hypothetical protein
MQRRSIIGAPFEPSGSARAETRREGEDDEGMMTEAAAEA